MPKKKLSVFKDIKNKIKNRKGALKLSYTGKNWGLCSNSIHFFDLLMFFTKFNKQNYIADYLNNKIILSKRKNYYELKGKIEIYNSKYHLILEDSDIFYENVLKIELGKIFYTIKFDKKNKCNILISNIGRPRKINIPLQSNLTLQKVKNLIKNNKFKLTKLEDYFNYQSLLIKIFNKKFSSLLKKIINCPIT